MELGQFGLEHEVLEASQDLVADILIEWHPSAAGGSLKDQARPHDRIALPPLQGTDDILEALRCVLAVAVEHDDDVQVVVDRQAVSGLLIAPISKVARV